MAAIVTVETLITEVSHGLRNEFVTVGQQEAPTLFYVEEQSRRFPFGSHESAQAAQDLLNRINALAHPGERLFVGPADLRRTNYNDTFLYYMLPHLRPASYFLEMNPNSANRPNSRLTADIRTADWLILNRLYDTWVEPNSSSRNGSAEPNEAVQEEFTLRGKFGPYLLYQHNVPSA